MTLTREKRRELGALGWSLVRGKAERPAAVPSEHVLRVGEQFTLDERTRDRLLTEVEDER